MDIDTSVLRESIRAKKDLFLCKLKASWFYMFCFGVLGAILPTLVDAMFGGFGDIYWDIPFLFGWDWFSLNGAIGAFLAVFIYFIFLQKKDASLFRWFCSVSFVLILFFVLYLVLPVLIIISLCYLQYIFNGPACFG